MVRLAKAFPELPMDRLKAMQSQQSPSQSSQGKAKVTIHKPSRRKVLLTANPMPGEGMLSPDFLLSVITTLLLACHFTLVAEVVTPAYGSFTVTCDSMATQEELYAIRDRAIPIFPAGSL